MGFLKFLFIFLLSIALLLLWSKLVQEIYEKLGIIWRILTEVMRNVFEGVFKLVQDLCEKLVEGVLSLPGRIWRKLKEEMRGVYYFICIIGLITLIGLVIGFYFFFKSLIGLIIEFKSYICLIIGFYYVFKILKNFDANIRWFLHILHICTSWVHTLLIRFLNDPLACLKDCIGFIYRLLRLSGFIHILR